jgi:hypothetical protein
VVSDVVVCVLVWELELGIFGVEAIHCDNDALRFKLKFCGAIEFTNEQQLDSGVKDTIEARQFDRVFPI